MLIDRNTSTSFRLYPLLLKIVSITLLLAQAFLGAAHANSNSDILEGLLGNIAACNLSKRLMADIPPQPIYQANSGSCDVIVDELNSVQTVFSDALCEQPFSYRTTSLPEYCLRTLNKELLGNGADLVASEPHWSLSPGNRYDLGALPLQGLRQPYVSRVPYRTVSTAGGSCTLEMRIYKSSPTASGLKSMIALHGGSWTSRGFGYFGLEMSVPHFTDADFVVFAPFYRLLDSREGNAACHNATIQEVISDADAALQWVRANAANYGASDYPVVFGQSAGAHLAASLAVHQPTLISNAVLFYPPTDFTDFAAEIRNGNYTNEQGLDILQRVIGGPADTVDLSASPIPENTFPTLVESNPDAFPPMFILHGLADELVDARQALRLCAALGGSVADALDADTFRQAPELRHKLDCDTRQSTVHLTKEGQHALDVCPSNNLLLSDICLSGSEQSRALVADSISAAVAWAVDVAALRAGADVTPENPSTPPDTNDSTPPPKRKKSGALAVSWLLMLLGFYLLRGFPSRRDFK